MPPGPDEITSVEGLGTPDDLYPLQRALIEQDGYQCGFCTPGQIMSALGILNEVACGVPSHVTADLTAPDTLDDTEIRVRVGGNTCCCAASPNNVAAIRDAADVPT